MAYKKILITGGCGFVGSHLVEKLSQDKNNKIYVIDNFFTGKDDNKINKDNVFYAKFESKDIDFLCILPDIVYHLGEYSRVLTSFEDIENVVEYNAIGTLAIIEYCRKYNIRLIYAGSSTKFGDAESPYSFFKNNNTETIKRYGKWFGLDYAIAYFYNVYGPRQISEGKYATLIGIFEENIKKNRPHQINKPGTQTRIFTHVDDIIEGLVLIGEKGEGEYCLGSTEEYSIKKIADMFGGKIEYKEAKNGDRNYSKINLRKIEKLGWKARKTIKSYIKSVL